MLKKKVLQIVGDPVGGIRKHVHDILMGLNNEFDFYYVSSQNGDKAYIKEIDSISSAIVNHFTLDIRKKPSLNDIYNIFKIYQFIRRNNIELVHGHGAKGGLYARICGKLTGCKVVYTPHGGVVHSMFGRLESKLYRVIERVLCHFTDLLVFESNYTANAFSQKFGCARVKSVVNYNGVNPPEADQISEYTKRDVDSIVKIGVFGVLRKEKGQQLALQAVKSLINDGHNIHLHFYGDGPLKKNIQDDITKSKLDDMIFLHGEVDNVYPYMQQVDFVLIPSLFESFGYIAVEAMFAKKPIISSNAGGLKEILNQNTSFIFEVNSLSGIKNAIALAMSENEDVLNGYVKKSYVYVSERFKLSIMIKGLSTCYTSLL